MITTNCIDIYNGTHFLVFEYYVASILKSKVKLEASFHNAVVVYPMAFITTISGCLIGVDDHSK